MASHEFHGLLETVRKMSRWPELPDFAHQVEISLGGYKKYENGTRIPSPKMLERIIERGQVVPSHANKLRELRDDAKVSQVGMSLEARKIAGQSFNADPDKLTERLVSEAIYVLKQSGVKPTEKTQRVLKKRFAMILKAALEG